MAQRGRPVGYKVSAETKAKAAATRKKNRELKVAEKKVDSVKN